MRDFHACQSKSKRLRRNLASYVKDPLLLNASTWLSLVVNFAVHSESIAAPLTITARENCCLLESELPNVVFGLRNQAKLLTDTQ